MPYTSEEADPTLELYFRGPEMELQRFDSGTTLITPTPNDPSQWIKGRPFLYKGRFGLYAAETHEYKVTSIILQHEISSGYCKLQIENAMNYNKVPTNGFLNSLRIQPNRIRLPVDASNKNVLDRSTRILTRWSMVPSYSLSSRTVK